jgi:DNA replication protein DnaC
MTSSTLEKSSPEQLRPEIRKLTAEEIEGLLRRLNLARTRRIYADVADRAEKEQWPYRDFLAFLMAEEVAHRQQTRLMRFTRKAHFPFFRTIEEFDFHRQPVLRKSHLGSYLEPDFVREGRSLILYGKHGRGKTHLAVGIGYRAIQNGFETLCANAAELIEGLSNASKRGQLQQALFTYTHPHVLICDEIGYLAHGQDAANVLFHVVNDRYLKKRPIIFTTNKPLSAWGKVLHDEDLAAAILDRILERGRFIHLEGPSGRTGHQLDGQENLPATPEGARISGIDRPKFPEPTPWNQTPLELRERAVEQLSALSSAQPRVRGAAERMIVQGREYLCVLKYSASFAAEQLHSVTTALAKALPAVGQTWGPLHRSKPPQQDRTLVVRRFCF